MEANKKKLVHIIMCSTGDWEDYRCFPMCVVTGPRRAAKTLCKKANRIVSEGNGVLSDVRSDYWSQDTQNYEKHKRDLKRAAVPYRAKLVALIGSPAKRVEFEDEMFTVETVEDRT